MHGTINIKFMIYMYLHLVTEIKLLRNEEMWRYFSIQYSPVSDRVLIICKVHRLRSFVVLVGATCRRRRVRRFDGMILQRNTEVLRQKPVPVTLLSPQISYGLEWDRTRAFAVKGMRLTPWDTARSLRANFNFGYKYSARTAQYTPLPPVSC